MSTREDARVIKTKAKLLSAFKELLCKKSFEDITVNEICDAADVRRATFYKHFPDKYAFLKYLVGTLRDSFDSNLPKRKKPNATSAYYTEYIRALVNFLTENELMVKNALESDVLPTLIEVIKEKNYEDTCERLRESIADGMTLPASVEVTASMMTGAVAGTLLNWFNSGKNMPVEQLVCEMSAVIASIQS
jgi:AcrR family transcriptional regulator